MQSAAKAAVRVKGTAKVSLAQRILHKIHKKFSMVPIAVLTLCSCVEVASLAVYIYTEELRVGSSPQTFYVNTPCFIAQVAFAIFFSVEWCLALLFEEFKVSFLFSFQTLISSLTCFPMVIVGIGALVNPEWQGGWVPMFLRVWRLHNHLLVLLDYPELASLVNDLHREMVRFTIGLLSTMITCVGIFQAVETFTGGNIHFFESSYFIVVTFGTIGYGDYYPTTTLSRLVVVVIIIVAIYTFPQFFANLAELAKQKPKYTFYTSNQGRSLHVIIIGSLSDRDVAFFLNEFFSGSRRFINLNIVLLSDREFSQETRLLVSAPTYKDRVTLVLGDCLRALDLERCDAAFADAVFLVSSNERSSFTDYHIIQRAMAVRQFDGRLPQHIMLKRERNTRFVAPIATTVMEKERLKFTLLGMAAVLPGTIPLIVNLIRTYDPAPSVRACSSWMEQNEWSMGQETYSVKLPAALMGVPFLDVAVALSDHAVCLMGVVKESSSAPSTVVLNPSGRISSDTTKLVVIAEDYSAASSAIHDVSEVLHFGTNNTVARVNSGSSSHMGVSVVVPQPHPLTETQHNAPDQRSRLSSSLASDGKSIVRIEAAAHLQDHFVLIDLSSAHSKPNLSPEAAEEVAHFKATDLLNVIRPITYMYPDKDIIILAREEPNPYFVKLWRKANRRPILFIEGCGLNFHDVRRCNVAAAFGAVIFSSEERSDANADAMTLLTALSVEEVVKERNPSVPIVTEIEQIDSLSLFPPFYTEDAMSALAEENWAFEPNFIIGDSVCSAMLDPALYQSYFNSELLKTIDAMTFGGDSSTTSRISLMRFSEADKRNLLEHQDRSVQIESKGVILFSDVVRLLARRGLVAIGIHRIIHDAQNSALNGRRFMLTNPPPELPIVVDEDIIYFLTRVEVANVQLESDGNGSAANEQGGGSAPAIESSSFRQRAVTFDS